MSCKAIVYLEGREEVPKEASLDAVAAAQRLAHTVVGVGLWDYPDWHGFLDEMVVVNAEPLSSHIAEALARVAEDRGADYLVVAATPLGKEVAPQAAARLGATFVPEAVELAKEEDGLVATRMVYTGKIVAKFRAQDKPLVVLVRPKAFGAPEAGRACTTSTLSYSPDALAAKLSLVELREKDPSEIDVTEADIVVSGGRGLRGPEGFELLRELAEVLAKKTGKKVAIGASRSAVDEGWIDHSHQVGQTGKIVSPELYIAVGISGAMQHLAGMKSSKIIVAINKDPEAPIFSVSDFGVVDDLFKVVPELTKRLAE